MDALKVHLSEGKDVRANMWKAAEVSFMCSVPGLAACGVTHKNVGRRALPGRWSC